LDPSLIKDTFIIIIFIIVIVVIIINNCPYTFKHSCYESLVKQWLKSQQQRFKEITTFSILCFR